MSWLIVVRQRMPAAVLTAGRARLAVTDLFEPRRVRLRVIFAGMQAVEVGVAVNAKSGRPRQPLGSGS
jgi:hypothetical protein